MSLEVTLAVLGAALAHAAWNAMVKSGRDVQLDMALLVLLSGIVALPGLAFVPPPAPASWPWLAASVVVHVAYMLVLVATYRGGDLSHAYPVMRGLAPLIVSVSALLWLGEAPGAAVWAGVLLICGGVVSLGLAGLDWRKSRVSMLWALANAAIIAFYTLLDAAGVRLSQSPAGYVLWLFVLNALPMPLLAFLQRRGEALGHARRFWARGAAGAALSVASYGIVLWAMTLAPIAAVAALRETSVIFAALIGAWLLREGHVARRVAGAAVVAIGVIALRM
jgi:drug/metabolite transporter (DMT)-like permease